MTLPAITIKPNETSGFSDATDLKTKTLLQTRINSAILLAGVNYEITVALINAGSPVNGKEPLKRFSLTVNEARSFSVNTGQFGVFVDPAGLLRNSAALDLDLNNKTDIEQFTGQTLTDVPGISGLQQLNDLSIFAADDLDLLRFNLSELSGDELANGRTKATDVVTLRHTSGFGIVTLELLNLDATAGQQVLRTVTTAATPEVELNLGDLTPGINYALRVTGQPSVDDSNDPLRYELLPDVGDSSSLVLSLSLEPEDTGLNRILGQSQADVLFGGTGLDFLYGNQAPAGESDVLYGRRGQRFDSLGVLAGDEWKEYAKSTDKVWYYGGSNLDDVINVDYVTDQDSVLANRHLITRLTGNNGNFTFDAQVQLSFDATDEDGNLIWNPEDTFFDHNLTADSAFRTALAGLIPAPATISDNVRFVLKIDNQEDVTVTVLSNSLPTESTAADVVALLNESLTSAVRGEDEIVNLSRRVRAELVDDRIELRLLTGSSFTLNYPVDDPSANTIGFADGQTSTAGQLSDTAQFFLSVYGDSPVLVTVEADAQISSVAQLVVAINDSLQTVNLGTTVVAEVLTSRLPNGLIEESIRFRLTDNVPRTTGQDDRVRDATVPLQIMGINDVTLNELHFADGQASVRERTGDVDVTRLLPPEGDFDAIIIDALDGDDEINVGPTVIKSVWIDAGPGNDIVDIKEGRPILPDLGEREHVIDGRTVVGNDTPGTAYQLLSPAIVIGQTLPASTGRLTGAATFTVDIKLPEDVDGIRKPSSTLVTVQPSPTSANNRNLDDLIDDINAALSTKRAQFDNAGTPADTGFFLSEFVTARRFGQAIGFVTVNAGSDVHLQVAADPLTSAGVVARDELGIPVSSTDTGGLDPSVGINQLTMDRTQIITGLTIDDESDVDWYRFSIPNDSSVEAGHALVLTSLSANDQLTFSLHQNISGTLTEISTGQQNEANAAEHRIDLKAVLDAKNENNFDLGAEILLKVQTNAIPTVYQLEFLTQDYLEA
ncbi:MAG: hypothetical protein ABGZ17_28155, partial [Planctomycetaceae bacterium]